MFTMASTRGTWARRAPAKACLRRQCWRTAARARKFAPLLAKWQRSTSWRTRGIPNRGGRDSSWLFWSSRSGGGGGACRVKCAVEGERRGGSAAPGGVVVGVAVVAEAVREGDGAGGEEAAVVLGVDEGREGKVDGVWVGKEAADRWRGGGDQMGRDEGGGYGVCRGVRGNRGEEVGWRV